MDTKIMKNILKFLLKLILKLYKTIKGYTVDLQALRARKNNKDISKIVAQFEKATNSGGIPKDDRLWKMTEDKAKNATAIIRFLPATNEDDLNWVKILSYGFSDLNKTKYYINNSLRTIGEIDPVYELNGKLREVNTVEAKAQRENQKQITSYYSNILVVSDPLAPQNEGKVFIFKYGSKILEMLMDQSKKDPLYPEKEGIDVFDVWHGANFRLRRYMANSGYPSYDKSTFEAPSELCNGDEDRMLEVIGEMHDLKSLLDRKNFGTYEDLSRQLARFSIGSSAVPSAVSLSEKLASLEPSKPKSSPAMDEEEDDVMNYFKSISEAE